jgi:hypothetical protein
VTTDKQTAPLALGDAEKWATSRLKQTAERVAADLADLAERIQREAAQIDRPRGGSADTYVSRAAYINSRVLNALPNLGLSALINDAGAADSIAADQNRDQA